jgi:hypothetical protein
VVYLYFCEIAKKKIVLTHFHPLDRIGPSLGPSVPTREGLIHGDLIRVRSGVSHFGLL